MLPHTGRQLQRRTKRRDQHVAVALRMGAHPRNAQDRGVVEDAAGADHIAFAEQIIGSLDRGAMISENQKRGKATFSRT